MSTTSQTQLRVSLSSRMGALLAHKADEVGVPVTQFVKFLIFKAVEQNQTPYLLSERSEKKIERALKDISKSDVTEDMDEYLKTL